MDLIDSLIQGIEYISIFLLHDSFHAISLHHTPLCSCLIKQQYLRTYWKYFAAAWVVIALRINTRSGSILLLSC